MVIRRHALAVPPWALSLIWVTALLAGLYAVGVALGVEEAMLAGVAAVDARWAVALLCFALLASDAALPVPSSLTMIAGGAALGLAGGAAVAVAGGATSAVLCFAAGRRLGALAEARRDEIHVLLLVAALRPVPLAAESSAVAAGRTAVPATRFVGASVLGLVPTALVWAWVGSRSADATSLSWVWWIYGGVLLVVVVHLLWRRALG